MASGANKAETELMGSFIWDRLGGLQKKAPKKLLRESYQTPRKKEKEKKEKKKPTKRPLGLVWFQRLFFKSLELFSI